MQMHGAPWELSVAMASRGEVVRGGAGCDAMPHKMLEDKDMWMHIPMISSSSSPPPCACGRGGILLEWMQQSNVGMMRLQQVCCRQQ